MTIRLAVLLALSSAAPVAAQTASDQTASDQTAPAGKSPKPAAARPSPSEAAAAFTLDGVAPQGDAPAAGPAEPVQAPAAPPVPAPLTLDTPIADLIADPAGRAVLDRDLPGLSTDENLAKFQAKSLHQFQSLTGGQMTDAMLAKVAADLAAPPRPAKPRIRMIGR